MNSLQMDELRELAEVVAEWCEPAMGLEHVYLFGSRVRGDHRPDSDVDLRIFMEEWRPDDAAVDWWMHQNTSDFEELKAKLPGPLAIHCGTSDRADAAIRAGAKPPVLTVGKVVCVSTPAVHKAGSAIGVSAKAADPQ